MSELAWEEGVHLEGEGREEHYGKHKGLDLWESEWGGRERTAWQQCEGEVQVVGNVGEGTVCTAIPKVSL